MSPEVIEARIATAERYLELIDSPLHGDWIDLRSYALASRDLPTALALVHPDHWSEHAQARAILGPREFRAQTLRGTRFCSSADYWGAPCRRRDNPDAVVVADHAWPYSLGGPTVQDNIRWLCRRHNAAKSSDIHLYPWDGLWPTWLDALLDRVARARANASLS